jgi:DNA invertase Pin-like site-specific DNA recombinase
MDSGVEFVATDMPQANRFTIHILAAVAEHEAKMISDRTKAAMAAAKARGAKFGCPNGARALRGHGGNAHARAAVQKKADEHATAVRPIIDALRDEGITGLKGIAGGAQRPVDQKRKRQAMVSDDRREPASSLSGTHPTPAERGGLKG